MPDDDSPQIQGMEKLDEFNKLYSEYEENLNKLYAEFIKKISEIRKVDDLKKVEKIINKGRNIKGS